MSVTVIVSLTVADFNGWKTTFDAHEHARVAAGIHAKAYKNFDDEKMLSLSVLLDQKKNLLRSLLHRKCKKSTRMLA